MKRFLLILLCLLPVMANAADRISAVIAITNAPLGNTNSIVVDGSTRTWTNSVSGSPGTLIQQTNSIPYSATNLWLHLASYPADVNHVYLVGNNGFSNRVEVRGFLGEVFTVTVSPGWATVTYTTNTVSTRLVVTVPYTIEAATNQTNIGSMLLSYVNDRATNSFTTNAVAMSNYMTLATVQTVAAGATKTFLNTNSFTNSTWRGGTIAEVTNFSGYLRTMTNGYWTNGIGENITITNLSVPGAGINSIKLGANSAADGMSSTAIGDSSSAAGSQSVALGYSANASGAAATSVGASSVASGSGSVSFGNSSQATGLRAFTVGFNTEASYDYSGAIGPFAAALAVGQIRVGTTTNVISIPGTLAARYTTNSEFRGTNILSGSISTPASSFSTLGNGNNISVDFGTNYYVRLDGTITASASICGIVPRNNNGLWYVLENNTGYDVVLAQNTIDPVPANRITTFSGSDVTLPYKAFATIVYDSTEARWNIAEVYPVTTAATNAVAFLDGSATNLNTYSSAGDKVALRANGRTGTATNIFEVTDTNGAVRLGLSSNGIPILGPFGSVNEVWTLTNATTGEGEWAAVVGGSGWTSSQTNVTIYASNTTDEPLTLQPLTGTTVPVARWDWTNALASQQFWHHTNDIFATNIDASNYELLQYGYDPAKLSYVFRSMALGSGLHRPIYVSAHIGETNVIFNTNGSLSVQGDILFSADNTYDIGASGATRPRNLFIAGAGIFAGEVAPLNLQLPSGGAVYWAGTKGFITQPANGVYLFNNSAQNWLNRISLGLNTAVGRSIQLTNAPNAAIRFAGGDGGVYPTNDVIIPGTLAVSNAVLIAPTTGWNTGDSLSVKQTNGTVNLSISAVTASAHFVGTTNVSSTVFTVDATQTNLYTFTPIAGATYFIQSAILADNSADAGSGAGYVRHAAFKVSNAGAVTQIGTTTAVSSHEDNVNFDATIDTSGGLIRVRVTGDAATDLFWKHKTEIMGAFYD